MQPYVYLSLGLGSRPTNDISIEFKIQWKFVMLLFITYSPNHNKILHMSRQLHCRDLCKILLWSNQSTKFVSISNLIEIPWVGASRQLTIQWCCLTSVRIPTGEIRGSYPTMDSHTINSLLPSDVIWRYKSVSTSAQVMTCCLTAPSHHLNQCWIITSDVQWQSPEGNFTRYHQLLKSDGDLCI